MSADTASRVRRLGGPQLDTHMRVGQLGVLPLSADSSVQESTLSTDVQVTHTF